MVASLTLYLPMIAAFSAAVLGHTVLGVTHQVTCLQIGHVRSACKTAAVSLRLHVLQILSTPSNPHGRLLWHDEATNLQYPFREYLQQCMNMLYSRHFYVRLNSSIMQAQRAAAVAYPIAE